MKNNFKLPLSGKALAVLTLLFFLSALAPKGAGAANGKITVAAAADLTFALKEIASNFKKETGTDVVMSFGSTGMLSKQISEGAPFDVFFAANSSYIEDLKKDGHVVPDTIALYARGRVVLAVNLASGVKAMELTDLLKPEIKRVAIANPEHAPYGKAAMEALKSKGLWDKLKAKLVYGENVRQTLQFIQTGNAQAGIVALSVANVSGATYNAIDPSLHNPIDQAVAVVKYGGHEKAARDFIRFVNSKGSREIMKKYGFLLPDDK